MSRRSPSQHVKSSVQIGPTNKNTRAKASLDYDGQPITKTTTTTTTTACVIPHSLQKLSTHPLLLSVASLKKTKTFILNYKRVRKDVEETSIDPSIL